MAGSPQYQNIIKELFKLAYPFESSDRLVTASIIKQQFPKLRVSNRSDWYEVAFACIATLRKDSTLIPQSSQEKTEQLIASVESASVPATVSQTSISQTPIVDENEEEDDEEYFRKEIERKKAITLFHPKLLAEEEAYGNDTAVELLKINRLFCGAFVKLSEIVLNSFKSPKLGYTTFLDKSCLKDYKITGKFTDVFGYLESELPRDRVLDVNFLHHQCHNLYWKEYGKLDNWTDTSLKNVAICKFELTIEDQKFYFSMNFWDGFKITALNRNTNKYESLFDVVDNYNFLDVLYETCTRSPEINEARKYRLLREQLVAGNLAA